MDWTQVQGVMAVVLVPLIYTSVGATLRWSRYGYCSLCSPQARPEVLLPLDSRQPAAIMTWAQAKAEGKEARADRLFDIYITIGTRNESGGAAGKETKNLTIRSHRSRGNAAYVLLLMLVELVDVREMYQQRTLRLGASERAVGK